MIKPTEVLDRVILFVRMLFARFIEDQGVSNAAALAYTTLLSLVPLMTVVLAIFAAFPMSEQLGQQLQDFVFKNFVPESGAVVQQYLQQFSRNAARVTGAGFIFLIIVALMMVATIDRALNTIWRVKRERSTLSKVTMYWAVLSLGPLLIGLSVVVTSYIVSMPLFSDSEATMSLRAHGLEAMPMLSSVIAFTLLYAVVPNRRVPLFHALAGGILAALLFELAKHGFALYLTHFPSYQVIYGTLGVIPIFLVWIYLSWMITLLGAEFSCCLGIFRGDQPRLSSAPGHNFLLAYRVLYQLWQAQKAGKALSTNALENSLGRGAEEQLEARLSELQQAHLVLQTEQGDWALARDLSSTSLRELYASGSYVLPPVDLLNAATDAPCRVLLPVLERLDADLQQSMRVTLEELYLSASANGGQSERGA